MIRLFLLLLALLQMTAVAAAAADTARPLNAAEKTVIAGLFNPDTRIHWFDYRPGAQPESPYCAMASIRPPGGGLPVTVPFFAVVGPSSGAITRARMVARGEADPLAPINLLIGEMCDRAGYRF
jgi:hypothetical protein